MKENRINIKSKDGTKIPVLTYNLEEKPIKGIVIFIHGFGEHSGSYKELIKYITDAGYKTVIFDQRGHGRLSTKSPKKRAKLRGIIPSYESFLEDIDAVTAAMKRKSPNTPIVIYGHSMGGNITTNYLLKHGQSNFSCAVLESPWLGLYNDVKPITKVVANILGRISPKIAIIKELPKSDITGDSKKVERMEKDPLYHNRISLRMFSGIQDGCAYALNNAGQLSIPIHLAFAKNEKIVNNQAIQRFGSKCNSNVILKEYESHHSIHSDVNKEFFYRDVIEFLNTHCYVNKL